MKRTVMLLLAMLMVFPALTLAEGGDALVPAETPDAVSFDMAATEPTPKPVPVTLSIDNQNLYDGMTKTYSQGYSPTVQNGVATVVLPLMPSGRMAGDTVTATPNLGSIAGSPFVFGNYEKSIPLATHSINGGTNASECYYVRFDFALVADRQNGVYPVTIAITGRDIRGNDISQMFTTYITISDGQGDIVPAPAEPPAASSGSSGPTASKPVLVIETCTVNPNSISRGDTFEVELVIKNVGRRTAHNVRVSIVSDDANIVLVDDYSAKYLRSLAANKAETFSFQLEALPLALGGLHNMTVNLSYERTDNIPYADTAVFRVNVSQPLSLSFDAIKLPEKITSGESFTLPVCAYNTGLANIYNVKFTLDVPGLIAASAYLGNLAPQASAEKNMSVFATTIDAANKYGLTYGTCLITYEDETGNQMQELVDLKMEIVEPVKITDEEKKKEEEKAEEQETLSQWWISLLFGVAIIAVLTSIIIIAKFSRMMRMR